MAIRTIYALTPDDPSLDPQGRPAPLSVSTDPDELAPIAKDAGALEGSGAAGLAVPSSEGQLARWLRDNPAAAVIVQGALTSLTGGATPSDDIVISTKKMTSLRVDPANLRAVVGAGLTLSELQAALADEDLYYPPAPTHDGASLGGNVATNAAGAATFKYGTTRDWVERLRIVLASGDVLELRRGQCVLEPSDRVRIEASVPIEFDVPSYESPALKKSSVGYYGKRPWDLIDLFIGSEGTLGIVTEIEVRLVPRPSVLTGLCFLHSVADTLALVTDLRQRSLAAWAAKTPGMDVRAIEYFDARCLQMLRNSGKLAEHGVDVPPGAVACLLFEQEIDKTLSHDEILERLAAVHEGKEAVEGIGELMAVLMAHEVVEHTELALPSDSRRKRQLAAIREAIPLDISDYLRAQHEKDKEIHKVAGDMIVPMDHFAHMLGRYDEVFRQHGVDVVIFGHISDGNVHPNGLPRQAADMPRAKQALWELAQEAKALGGCPLSEHGVGKHP